MCVNFVAYDRLLIIITRQRLSVLWLRWKDQPVLFLCSRMMRAGTTMLVIFSLLILYSNIDEMNYRRS